MRCQPETVEELIKYCLQRAKENEKRSIKWKDRWHEGKADTYRRLAEKLAHIKR
jgi:hypothetical protein